MRISDWSSDVCSSDLNVRPVEVEEFQIGTAETYDIVLEPTGEARTIVAESMDRSGMAVATLASRPGARAAVPALRDPPLLTMADMGMNHGSGGMDHGGGRSEEHTSELQSLMRISYAVFCLQKKNTHNHT